MLSRFRPATLLIGPALLAASLTGQASAASSVVAAPAQARFAINLPLRNQAQLDALLADLQNPSSPRYHRFLSHEEFANRFGPTATAKAAVARELASAGFTVRVTSQNVFAHGPSSLAARYFHTNFSLRSPDGVSKAVLTPRAPLQRSPLVTSLGGHIIGLDGTPEFHSNAHFSQLRTTDPRNPRNPLNYYGEYGPYFAIDLKQAYDFPSYAVANGKGVYIGIISSSPVATSDYTEYFKEQNEPVPVVDEFPIDGGGTYDASGGATGEATLDVEQSGGAAPGATIGVFDVPSLGFGDILLAYSVAMEAAPDIVSSSIGGCEKAFDTQTGVWELNSFHSVFAEGASEGITWVGASGDNGAFECGTGTSSANLSVQTPTDDPIMIGVGGTTLLATYNGNEQSNNSAYAGEKSECSSFTQHGGSIWGSDGGYSVIFALPAYQKGFVSGSARGVPDLSMHMGGPQTNNSTDWIYEGGSWGQVSGTSAAAPEFAGLLALRVQILKGPQGDLHNALYALAKTKGNYHTGIEANNGHYVYTTTAWDPVLGLGTPANSRAIAGAPTAALAGIPFTATNP
jgi:subtilase family serine protease